MQAKVILSMHYFHVFLCHYNTGVPSPRSSETMAPSIGEGYVAEGSGKGQVMKNLSDILDLETNHGKCHLKHL